MAKGRERGEEEEEEEKGLLSVSCVMSVSRVGGLVCPHIHPSCDLQCVPLSDLNDIH